MFYEDLYTVLGRLFYFVAMADGKVQVAEIEVLQNFIQEKWKPVEQSKDEFGTDQANLIGFSFEFEESEGSLENAWNLFKTFYKQNKLDFTPDIKSNILDTAKGIALSNRGKSKKETEIIDKIKTLFAE